MSIKSYLQALINASAPKVLPKDASVNISCTPISSELNAWGYFSQYTPPRMVGLHSMGSSLTKLCSDRMGTIISISNSLTLSSSMGKKQDSFLLEKGTHLSLSVRKTNGTQTPLDYHYNLDPVCNYKSQRITSVKGGDL